MTDSRISGLYRLPVEGRVRALAAHGFLSDRNATALLAGAAVLDIATADKMIENVIGVFGLPLAVAPNLRVNGRDCIAPMVVEEASIVAGISGAAKLFLARGGFAVTSAEPLLIGQIQVIGINDPDAAIRSLYAAQSSLLAQANESQPKLVARGGGAREIEYFKYRLPDGRWTVVLHLIVDTRDAMGANVVNTMCEQLAPRIEKICKGRVCLRILSNLADKSLVTVRGTVALTELADGEFAANEVRDAIILANDFANADPYRAATHNKGIMNGIDAVAIATGNDWRATEAAAHAFAVRDGGYRSLTKWWAEPNGDLAGEMTLPLRVGIVGGSQASNPAATLGIALTGARSGTDLAELMAAVGLAQNLAALRALVTHGIQKGHMSLHARNVAATAGAPAAIFDEVVSAMIESGEVKAWKATQLIHSMQGLDRRDTVAEAPRPGARGEAAGKVILLGEHAVVYDRHALALPLPATVVAHVVESTTGMLLAIPDWGLRLEWQRGIPPDNPASSAVELIMKKLDARGDGYIIHLEAAIPPAMGLGASAAFAVAVVRAFAELLGANLSNAEVDRIAFACEKLSHGTPSGVDNNIATYAEPVLFSKGTRTRTRPLQLSEPPPLIVASSGQRGSTSEQVAGVRARFERNRALYTTIFDEIDELTVAGAVALQACDYAELGMMMNVCHGLLNAIEVSTPELEAMVAVARAKGAVGAKLTGAGGGGSIVALCPGTTTDVARALRDAGYQIVRTAQA